MKQLIKELKSQLKEYKKLVAGMQKRGLDSLSYEDTETYGVFLGKVEVLEMMIPKLEDLNK